MKKFEAAFYGTTGSCSVSYPNRKKYGSNTACVVLDIGEEKLIIDMGMGSVRYSDITKKPGEGLKNVHILLSHFHYDHIEGIGFFTPFFIGGDFTIYSQAQKGESVGVIVDKYLNQPFFPVSPSTFKANMSYRTLKEEESFLIGNDVLVETVTTNHPGTCTSYKISYQGKSFVYLMDNEHTGDRTARLIEFCKGADVLVFDAQYTKEEYDTGRFTGWGHSTHEQGVEFAKAAGVGRLIFCHHAPWRTDDELDTLGELTKGMFENSIMAYEGLKISI